MNKKIKDLKFKLLMKDLEILRNEYYSKLEKIQTIKLLLFEEFNVNKLKDDIDDEIINENVQTDIDIKNDIDDEINENEIKDDIENVKEEIIEEKVDKNENNDIKKIFRQLVLKTHPDKNKNISEEYIQIYKEAVESYNNNNFLNIIFLGNKIGIDLSNLSEKRFDDIKEYNDELYKKIHIIDNDTLMLWYNVDDEDLKDVMYQRLVRQFKNARKKI